MFYVFILVDAYFLPSSHSCFVFSYTLTLHDRRLLFDARSQLKSYRIVPPLYRNVTFQYGNDSSKGDLLRGVNLKIKAGQNVAIVGPSGSGKSTTLRLISRMLDPNGGQVSTCGCWVLCCITAQLSTAHIALHITALQCNASLLFASH